MAAIEEKQVWNRLIALEKPGAKPNLKHWKLRAYDKRFETYAKQRTSGELSREEYWSKIIEMRANRWAQ